jgi:hypothetical protein
MGHAGGVLRDRAKGHHKGVVGILGSDVEVLGTGRVMAKVLDLQV